jgi:hypothetical protein
MGGRWRFNAAASIRIFECRGKILSGQRLRGQALKRGMRARPEKHRNVDDRAENHSTLS